ncbi:MAG: hypothetical protein J5I47_06030 [Vicingus serpentipes]|nr:hypothetical protein [Vicingus serpentipes]
MLNWEKLGQVLDLNKIENQDWMQEQAQNPYTVDMGDYIRVYFNCRAKKDPDGKSKSYAGFVDLDKNDLFKIINMSKKPIMEHGGMGDFDQFGIMAGSVVKFDNEYYLYYVGWTREYAVPYNWAIGLGISKDGGETFERYGRGPIIGASHNEPFLQAGCSTIIKIENVYHLWYTSGIDWIQTDSKPESVYQIMHAISSNGKDWTREGIPLIEEKYNKEAQASPSVMFFGDKWHMVFSYRHSVDFRNKERGYRLGYAWSNNLKDWHRNDEFLNFDVSELGWDSEMVCYPHLCKINNEIYLFYCGNDFGKYGFGIAKLIK